MKEAARTFFRSYMWLWQADFADFTQC